MATKEISELKSTCRLKIVLESGLRALFLQKSSSRVT